MLTLDTAGVFWPGLVVQWGELVSGPEGQASLRL